MPPIINTFKGIAVTTASLFLCVPFSTSAQVSTINYKGNVLEVKNMADTTEVLDPITMETLWEIRNPNPIPLKLNNMNIYADNEVEQRPSVTAATLRKYIIQQISSQLKTEGEYRLMLDNVIISDKGKIVYYNFDGVEEKQTIRTVQISDDRSVHANYEAGRTDWKLTNKVQASTVSTQVEKIIDKAPVYKPAVVAHQPVPCQLDTKELQKPFTIKKGVAQY